MRVRVGLEMFLEKEAPNLTGVRAGLLANQASVGPGYVHALQLIEQARPGLVVTLFNPQHGWAGEKQDNMVESDHGRDRQGRPIYSLYGETRRPGPEMLHDLDLLIVDLVDVGTRVYTFAQTLAFCLEEAGRRDLPVLVLDRPNPIGGREVEGNLLRDDCRSFVGLYPVPMRHGLTLGELAGFMNRHLDRPAPLRVLTCQNWRREQYFPETGLPWVYPSPNMPAPETAWVYPGQVLWEGTNISEARGTARPFHLMGAPFIDPEVLHSDLAAKRLPGLQTRPARFEPTFHKWRGLICGGLELFPLDKSFRPYLTSLTILEIILKRWPECFELKRPPYEYETVRRPLDLILGDSTLFERLAAGETAAVLEESWAENLFEFIEKRKEILLY